VTAGASAADADAERLRQLGYEQVLARRLRLVDNAALGFAAISPVVGLYAVALVGTTVAGPAWIWVLPVALAGQCLLLAVYSELASEFPVAGGAYQWPRRLVGDAYGWFSGWVAVCAYLVANTTIAYLGAPWALALLGLDPTPGRIVLAGMVLVVVCALVGTLGVGALGRAVKAGIAAEILATVGIGVALLLAFREQDLSLLGETLGAPGSGSTFPALLAALAVGGWVFIGFDACVAAAEETRDAARRVPAALWLALLGVGGLVVLNAVAVGLAHPDPAAVVAGEDVDPVTTAVVSSFGSWSDRPFDAVVLVAFVACGASAQALTARTLFSISRDGVLPGSRALQRVDERRRVPLVATAVTAVVACLGLLLGLEAAAVGSLIAFGTASIYVAFFLVALAALIARVRGSWVPAGTVRLGRRAGLVINAAAVAWLAFETVNIAWPRESLAPPGAPAYQVWAAPIVLGVIAVAGAAYLLLGRPRLPERSGSG
jgi:amino acid transporter